MKLLHTLLKFVVPLLLASPTFSVPYVCCGGGPSVGWCSKVGSAAERRSVALPLAENFVCCCTAPSTKLCGEYCVSITLLSTTAQSQENFASDERVVKRSSYRAEFGYIYERVAESFKFKVQN